jgi:hypothetical protein
VGRIAALDSIKSEIVKWLGLPIAVVTAIAGLLGYLGVTNIINTEVQTHVAKEIDKNFDAVTKEMHNRFFAVTSEEAAIKVLEQDSKKTLDTAKQELADLQKNKTELTASLEEIKKETDSLKNSERVLQKTMTELNLGPFIAKLQYDFDHVREFGLSAFIDLDPPIDHDFATFPHAEYVMLLGENEAHLAKLERDSAAAREDPKGISGVNIKFALAAAEQDKILNRKIEVLSRLTGAQLVFYCDSQFRDKLKLFTKSVKAIHLLVLTNGRPLWKMDLSKPEMVESSEGNNSIFISHVQLENYGDSLRSKYENLFKDNDSQ